MFKQYQNKECNMISHQLKQTIKVEKYIKLDL